MVPVRSARAATSPDEVVQPTASETATPEPLPWLKPAVIAAILFVALVNLLSLGLAFATQAMPPSHYIAGPIAIGVITLIWFAELSGLRGSLLVFAAVATVPNLFLALIGHDSINYLYLSLTVAWVAYQGSYREGVVALVMNLAVLGVNALYQLESGRLPLEESVAWGFGLVIFWLTARAFLSQQRLAAELQVAQQDLLRLYAQAQRTAQLEERQRLARELHDAVTQTLFSSSLIADVLPRLWERDPGEARRRLDELRELTRGALAEMRTLLYELRPTALTEAPLGDLLRPLVDATIGHAHLPIALTVEGQSSSDALPSDVQVALYRIGQEALNNVVKHARASHSAVTLIYRADGVELSVRDDGQGFDPSQRPPGHLGLGNMSERAADVGIELTIASQPGIGTNVTANWAARGRWLTNDGE
jgi:signal transduction histidine kinase